MRHTGTLYFDNAALAFWAYNTIQEEAWLNPSYVEYEKGYRVASRERESYYKLQSKFMLDDYKAGIDYLVFD